MLFDVLIFLLVIGELIFFHEMGHFIAAKACGIYCERFSLGMPPRLFGIRFGETDYCVGLLPIGGYVKMAGQEDVPLTDEERKEQYGNIPPERWFSSKPVWQRVIVIAAGPFMNVVLAVLLYAIVAAVGAHVPETKVDSRIGVVVPDSPASKAPLYKLPANGGQVDLTGEPDAVGWQTGDRILSMNGNQVDSIADVALDTLLSNHQPMRFVIERQDPAGTTVRYVSEVLPERLEGSEYPAFGIESYRTALIDRVTPGTPAAAAELQPGDVINRVDGKLVDRSTFTELVESKTHGEKVNLEILRNGEKLNVTIVPAVVGRIKDVVFLPGMYWALGIPEDQPLKVTYENPEFLARIGLRTGDLLKTVAGQPADTALLESLTDSESTGPLDVVVSRKLGLFGRKTEEFRVALTLGQIHQAISSFDLKEKPVVADFTPGVEKETGLLRNDIVEKIDGQPATVALLRQAERRPGETLKLTVRTPAVGYGVLREEETREVELPVTAVGQAGVLLGTRMVFHRASPGEVIPESLRLTEQAFDRIYRTLAMLLTGGLHFKEVGGPVAIFQMTTQAARIGYSWLLEITAFISVNLAIFNLLPLPVLDGGHLVFLTIEGVRRKPVSARVTEWVQQAGVFLIIALMLLVTYNDVKRWFLGTFMP